MFPRASDGFTLECRCLLRLCDCRTLKLWVLYQISDTATLIEAHCGLVAGTIESSGAIWCQLNYVKNHSILPLELARKTYFKTVP